MFYLASLNIVRQSVAMSIVLYSSYNFLLYDKLTIKFFFLIGLASSFL
ncbi:MAG: EpsG family protein [Haemophilus parainfluenzae]